MHGMNNEPETMLIAVVGAAGRTGRQIVAQALARGHGTIAVVRHPEQMSARDERMRVAPADVRDRERLCAALDGADAIVSALGTGTSRAATDIYSAGAINELHAMRANGIRRLAVVSAAPAGPREEQGFLDRRIAMPLLDRFFGRLYEDMRRMEELLRESDVDWVALRPPRLIERRATGAYRIDAKPLPRACRHRCSGMGGGREDDGASALRPRLTGRLEAGRQLPVLIEWLTIR